MARGQVPLNLDTDTDTNSGILYRIHTYDLAVIREQKIYDTMPLAADDTVLDLGANIGAYSRRNASKVRRIVAFEADQDNYELFTANTIGIDNVVGFRLAVMDDLAPDVIEFYENSMSNKGSHTVFETRGRKAVEVPTIRLSLVYDTWQPTAIKCDIEGAEYRTILTTDTPECVKKLIMEIHLNRPGFREKAHRLIDKLKNEGFTAIKEPVITESNWHTIAYFERK